MKDDTGFKKSYVIPIAIQSATVVSFKLELLENQCKSVSGKFNSSGHFELKI